MQNGNSLLTKATEGLFQSPRSPRESDGKIQKHSSENLARDIETKLRNLYKLQTGGEIAKSISLPLLGEMGPKLKGKIAYNPEKNRISELAGGFDWEPVLPDLDLLRRFYLKISGEAGMKNDEGLAKLEIEGGMKFFLLELLKFVNPGLALQMALLWKALDMTASRAGMTVKQEGAVFAKGTSEADLAFLSDLLRLNIHLKKLEAAVGGKFELGAASKGRYTEYDISQGEITEEEVARKAGTAAMVQGELSGNYNLVTGLLSLGAKIEGILSATFGPVKIEEKLSAKVNPETAPSVKLGTFLDANKLKTSIPLGWLLGKTPEVEKKPPTTKDIELWDKLTFLDTAEQDRTQVQLSSPPRRRTDGSWAGRRKGGVTHIPAMLEPGETVFSPSEYARNKILIENTNRKIPRFGPPDFSVLSQGRTSLPSGRTVPGFGEGDSVPAYLEPGSFVLNREATKALSGEHPDLQAIERKLGGLADRSDMQRVNGLMGKLVRRVRGSGPSVKHFRVGGDGQGRFC